MVRDTINLDYVKKEVYLELQKYLEWYLEGELKRIRQDMFNNSFKLIEYDRKLNELEKEIEELKKELDEVENEMLFND